MKNENQELNGSQGEAQNNEWNSAQNAEQNGKNTNKSNHIIYPSFINKTGVWPINISLFLFYSNVVSIIAMMFVAFTTDSSALSDPGNLAEKVNGVSMISAVLTLGLTIIYKRKFYLFRDTTKGE